MIFWKLILALGLLVTIIQAECPYTDDPKRVLECVNHVTSVLYGVFIKDFKMMCRAAGEIADCLDKNLGECIAAEIGSAALKEVQRITENCCPTIVNSSCPLHGLTMFSFQRCFAADSVVTLANGGQKQIIDLQTGDEILAFDDKANKLISTNVVTMLDHQPNQYALFRQLTTLSGRKLWLTSSHLLPTDIHGYVMAKNIGVGMNVYVVNDDGALISETISDVTDVIKKGYAAPLTQQGTLIVNNVAASCYATIDSHRLAHIALSPMRWWYGLFGENRSSNKIIGIHWFPQMLYEMTNFLIPSVLQN